MVHDIAIPTVNFNMYQLILGLRRQHQESIQAVNGARPTVMPSKHFHSGVPNAWVSS